MSQVNETEKWTTMSEAEKLKKVKEDLMVDDDESAMVVVRIRDKAFADRLKKQQEAATAAAAAEAKKKDLSFGTAVAAASLAKKASDNQAINWCATLHYDGEGQLDEEAALAQVDALEKISKYLIVGKEVCKTTGQKHLQMYVQLKARKRMTQLKKIMPSAHLEQARGDDQQNYDYCSKEGNFEEFGERKHNNNGKREQERWQNARDAAMEGRLEDVEPQIFVQHYGSIRAINKDFASMPENLNEPCGHWLYGLSGAGKSYTARKEFPGAFLKTGNKWWCGYQGQENVILDDLDKSHACLGYHLKIWADLYAFRAEVKGGAVTLRPKAFVVTSQYHPKDIFTDTETLDAITRRFKIRLIGPATDAAEGIIEMHMKAIKETAAAHPAVTENPEKLQRTSRIYEKRPDTPYPTNEVKRERIENLIDLLEEHESETQELFE